MRTIILFILLIVAITALGALASPVLAQDPPDSPVATPTPIINPDNPPESPGPLTEVPKTAQEAFDWLVLTVAAIFASFVGLIQTSIVDFLKNRVPWLNPEARQRISKGVARILYIAFNLVVGVLVSLALPYVGGLDKTGVWGALLILVGVTGLPIFVIGTPLTAELWHHLSKTRAR